MVINKLVSLQKGFLVAGSFSICDSSDVWGSSIPPLLTFQLHNVRIQQDGTQAAMVLTLQHWAGTSSRTQSGVFCASNIKRMKLLGNELVCLSASANPQASIFYSEIFLINNHSLCFNSLNKILFLFDAFCLWCLSDFKFSRCSWVLESTIYFFPAQLYIRTCKFL